MRLFMVMLMTLFMGVSNAQAAFQIYKGVITYTETGETEKVIIYNGDFEQNTSQMLNAALITNPEYKTVVFNSPGGVAYEGFATAAVLDRNGVTAWVPKGRICVSACAIAFLGAHEYRVSGQLAYHNAWLDGDTTDIAETYPGGINGLYGRAQHLGAYITYFLLANGFSLDFALDIAGNTSPSKYLVIRSKEELDAYYSRSETDTIQEYLVEKADPNIVETRPLYEYALEQLEELKDGGSATFMFEELIVDTTPKPVEEPSE